MLGFQLCVLNAGALIGTCLLCAQQGAGTARTPIVIAHRRIGIVVGCRARTLGRVPGPPPAARSRTHAERLSETISPCSIFCMKFCCDSYGEIKK